jgi:hypothetical protein
MGAREVSRASDFPFQQGSDYYSVRIVSVNGLFFPLVGLVPVTLPC